MTAYLFDKDLIQGSMGKFPPQTTITHTTTQRSYTPPLLNTTPAPAPPRRDSLHAAARDFKAGRDDDYHPASSTTSHEDYGNKRDSYREAGPGGWSRVDQETRDIAREAMSIPRDKFSDFLTKIAHGEKLNLDEFNNGGGLAHHQQSNGGESAKRRRLSQSDPFPPDMRNNAADSMSQDLWNRSFQQQPANSFVNNEVRME